MLLHPLHEQLTLFMYFKRRTKFKYIAKLRARALFSEKRLKKREGIIGQEIQMYQDNPDWRLYFGLIDSLFVKHPIKIDIAGTIESISKITKDLLYECYETFYHPSNMLLFVVGAIDPEKTMDLVRENQAKKDYKTSQKLCVHLKKNQMR